MGMRVGSGRERNPLLQRQPNDLVARIKFVNRFAPARRRELEGETTRANKIERFAGDCADIAARPMAMNFHQIEMREAIHQAQAANTGDIDCRRNDAPGSS